jgi:hypothetical protein
MPAARKSAPAAAMLPRVCKRGDRDPAHAQPFGACREPEVLDGAGRRGQVHLGQGAAAEHVLLAPRRQCHHQHLGGVEHALHLELHELVFALAQGFGRQHALLFDQRMDAFAQGPAAHADKTPGLHEAHAGRMVRGRQQALQQFVGHRAAAEVAHVAPLMNGPVHRLPLSGAEGVAGRGRIGRARPGRTEEPATPLTAALARRRRPAQRCAAAPPARPDAPSAGRPGRRPGPGSPRTTGTPRWWPR